MNGTIVTMVCNRCGGPIVNQFVPKGQELLHNDTLMCVEWLRTCAAELAAEVERLEAELAAETERLEDEAAMWQHTLTQREAEAEQLRVELAAMTEAWENQCAARVNDGAALYVQQFALEDEVAALRAQLDAAGEGWRPVSETPAADMDVEMVSRGGYRYDDNEFYDEFFGQMEMPTHWRPAPPQE